MYLGDWVYHEYMRKNLTFYQGTVITEMAVMVLLSIALNSYWMLLMIKMIVRIKTEGPRHQDCDVDN